MCFEHYLVYTHLLAHGTSSLRIVGRGDDARTLSFSVFLVQSCFNGKHIIRHVFGTTVVLSTIVFIKPYERVYIMSSPLAQPTVGKLSERIREMAALERSLSLIHI